MIVILRSKKTKVYFHYFSSKEQMYRSSKPTGVLRTLTKRKKIRGLLLDFCKTLDVVQHGILLHK